MMTLLPGLPIPAKAYDAITFPPPIIYTNAATPKVATLMLGVWVVWNNGGVPPDNLSYFQCHLVTFYGIWIVSNLQIKK